MALQDSFVKKEFPNIDQLEREERDKALLLEEMGLEDRDIKKLQAMMLSSDEAIHAKREELDHVRQRKGRKSFWQEYLDVERRIGRRLHHSEVLRRLRTVVPNLIVAPGGQQNRIGLYRTFNIPADQVEGYRGSFLHVDVPVYLGWMELGWMPEYEIDILNDVGVAISQIRGWRTILLRMIKRRDQQGRDTSVITEQQADQAFGPPSNGDISSMYRRQLWEFRNRRAAV